MAHKTEPPKLIPRENDIWDLCVIELLSHRRMSRARGVVTVVPPLPCSRHIREEEVVRRLATPTIPL